MKSDIHQALDLIAYIETNGIKKGTPEEFHRIRAYVHQVAAGNPGGGDLGADELGLWPVLYMTKVIAMLTGIAGFVYVADRAGGPILEALESIGTWAPYAAAAWGLWWLVRDDVLGRPRRGYSSRVRKPSGKEVEWFRDPAYDRGMSKRWAGGSTKAAGPSYTSRTGVPTRYDDDDEGDSYG